jgi:hypothetical protein
MGKILLPGDVWTEQPQYPAQIDTSGRLFNPNRVSVIIAPGSGSHLRDALSGKIYTQSANVSSTVNVKGRAVACTPGAVSYVTLDTNANNLLDSTSCTMIIATVRTSSTTYSSGTYGYVTPATGADRVSVNLPFTDNVLYWDYGNATAGSGRVSVSIAAHIAAGTVNIWGLVAGSRGREIWRNGVLLANDTGALATRVSNTSPFRMGSVFPDGSGTAANAHQENLFFLSREQLTTSALERLTRNPNLIFAPKQRNIWVDVSGGTSVSVDVTGLTGTTALGDETVTAIQNASTSVTGLTGTTALGTTTVTAIQNVSTSVTGLTGTTALGSVTVDVGGSTSVSVTGLTGTSALGTVSVTAVRNVSTSVTGLLGTSALGNITVTTGSGADVSVNVTGLSGTASLGTVLVWGLVDTAQTPNWLAISTTQTPNWTRIAT